MMQPLLAAISSMISLSPAESEGFAGFCTLRGAKKGVRLNPEGVPNEIYFVVRGMIRVVIADAAGAEHTVHFGLENQFIADYASFMLRQPTVYRLEALEETEVVVIPRVALEWGYAHMAQGDRLGRLVAESYFIYHDDRIKNLYLRTPKERYDALSSVFPNIHHRVPQHMIASYLGITPIHLSRLKKGDTPKS